MANARVSPTLHAAHDVTKLVADSASINGQPSSGYSSGDYNEPEPKFKGNVDKWRCPICNKVVRNPVQTACGHRFCERCLTEYLPADGTPVKCPANEEDCDMISRDESTHTFFKDMSARREVMSLPVYCLYYVYGCLVNLTWKDYSKHIGTCSYKRIPCPNNPNGCQEHLKPEELESHVKICQYKPQPCKYCGQVGMHTNTCPLKENECTFGQFGCTFEGNVPALEKHHKSFMPQHLEMLTVYVANMDLENTNLKSQLQAALNERDIQSNKVKELCAENKAIKETQKNVQRNLAKHEDRLTKLDGQFSKVDTEVSSQRRDLNLLQNTELLARAGDTGVLQRPVQESVEQLERQLGVFNLRMVEMDLRFQLLEASSYNGTLLWKITNYTKRKADAVAGKTLSLYSQPFYTNRHGYKMCGRVYLNGDGMGKGTHISLFFTVMKGDYDALLDWPFRQKVTFMILDQETGRNHLIDSFRPDPNSSSFKRPTSEMNIASGCPLFTHQSEVEGPNSRFIKDDTIFIKVIVDTQSIRHP